MKSTKKTLLSSVLALVLCFTMLLGSTFAWFTDSAVSSGNKIIAGTLDVELWQHTAVDASKNISDSNDPVFSGDILWEPNKTEVVYLSIRNNGNLALKYKVAIEVKQISDHDLTEVMYYYITPDAKFGEVTEWIGDENALQVNNGIGMTEVANDGKLLENGDEHFFALSIHMDDEAGNHYMGDSITFDIKVLAGQATYEEDSFDDQYDADAVYPVVSNKIVLDGNATSNAVFNANGMKVTAPKELVNELAAEANSLQLTYTTPVVVENKLVFGSVELYDENGDIVDLEALANDKPLTVNLYVGDLFAAGALIDVYHDDVAVATALTVDANGYVTYEALHFCEVTIAKNPTVKVNSAEELLAAFAKAESGDIIDATGVEMTLANNEHFYIPGGITLKGATFNTASRGGDYIIFTAGVGNELVFENCTFNRAETGMIILASEANGPDLVVYNNCVFNGPIAPNFVDNADGSSQFKGCTFGVGNAFMKQGYVNCMGGSHTFTDCTFDYTGGSTMGSNQYVRWNAVNSYSERYSTAVTLVNCTRINCGTQKYGANSTLTVK